MQPTTRSVEVSPFGADIPGYSGAMLEARDEMEKARDADLRPGHKVLRIGLSPSVNMPLLTDILQP